MNLNLAVQMFPTFNLDLTIWFCQAIDPFIVQVQEYVEPTQEVRKANVDSGLEET